MTKTTDDETHTLAPHVTLGPGYFVRRVGEVFVAVPAGANNLPWRPIEDLPPSKTYILLRGPSGYGGTPHRYLVARYDPEFRPLQPWVDHAGDSVLDGGEMPTEWCNLGETR